MMRLHKAWVFYATDNSLILQSTLTQARYRLRNEEPSKLQSLFETLAAGVAHSDYLSTLSERSGLEEQDVNDILEFLKLKQAVLSVDNLDDYSASSDQYNRQIRFFSQFETHELTAKAINTRLQKSRIMIVGLGGYGSWLALHCARIGIERIICVDPDIVERSNLNRQVLYDSKDVGRLKIDAVKEHLLEVDSSMRFEGHAMRIESPEDLEPYLAGVDLIFNPFGYVTADQAHESPVGCVAMAALRRRIPSLIFGGSWVGPLTIPGRTPCYWCFLSHDEINEAVRISGMRRIALGGSFSPRMAITASMAVWEATKYLTGIDESPCLCGVIMMDMSDHSRCRKFSLYRDLECGFCGKVRPGTRLRHEVLKSVQEENLRR